MSNGSFYRHHRPLECGSSSITLTRFSRVTHRNRRVSRGNVDIRIDASMTQALGNALRAHKFERMEAMSPIMLDVLSPRKPSDPVVVKDTIVPANNVYFPVGDGGDGSEFSFEATEPGESNNDRDAPAVLLGDLTGGGSTQLYLPDHSLAVRMVHDPPPTIHTHTHTHTHTQHRQRSAP